MNKLALFLTATLIAGVAMVQFSGNPLAIIDFDWTAQQKQQEFIENYHCFKQTLDDCLSALADDRMTLSEARERVESAARCYLPDFLIWLDHSEIGSSDSERVARNLLEHLRLSAGTDPCRLARVEELEMELEHNICTRNSI